MKKNTATLSSGRSGYWKWMDWRKTKNMYKELKDSWQSIAALTSFIQQGAKEEGPASWRHTIPELSTSSHLFLQRATDDGSRNENKITKSDFSLLFNDLVSNIVSNSFPGEKAAWIPLKLRKPLILYTLFKNLFYSSIFSVYSDGQCTLLLYYQWRHIESTLNQYASYSTQYARDSIEKHTWRDMTSPSYRWPSQPKLEL